MGRSKKSGDEEILRAIILSPDPVVTAPELAEKLDYSVDGIRNRLEELEEAGYVSSRQVGARATIWWIERKGRKQIDFD